MKNVVDLLSICLISSLILASGCKKKDSSSNPATSTGTVTDIDGNIYPTVTIGTQVWMAENLKVTHYRNGDLIAHISDNIQWSNLTSGAYCNNNNDGIIGITYGRLYNWYAIADGPIISPAGWHIPTSAELTIMTTFLGGESIAGGKLKETGITHWINPIPGATNETGFTALPGGFRLSNGTFYIVGYEGDWWSSTENNTSSAWTWSMESGYNRVSRGFCNKTQGLSVRCVRD